MTRRQAHAGPRCKAVRTIPFARPATTLTATTPSIRFARRLLTGAGGAPGTELRRRLKPHCDVLRQSDIVDLGAGAAGEERVPARLEGVGAMLALLHGVDAVVLFNPAPVI